MSRSSALTEAVKDILNANTYSIDFTAVRGYRLGYKYKELSALHITVLSPIIEQEEVSRVGNQDTISVDIVIQKQCKPEDNTAADALSDLVEEIAVSFRGTRYKKWSWIDTKIAVPYDPNELSDQQVFSALVTLRYRVFWK